MPDINQEMNDLKHRLTNHPPTENVGFILDDVTDRILGLGEFLLAVIPEGRERSLALTKLEELSMWTKAGIARNQVEAEEIYSERI